MRTINSLEEVQNLALQIIKDPLLTHEQQVFQLASVAQDALPFSGGEATEEFVRLSEEGLMHEMSTGHAPYSARYILPDYEKFMARGSEFLRLDPPQTLYEAVTALQILYHNVPSVTHFPVYLGNFSELFEPYCGNLSDDEIRTILRGFLIMLDRTLGDSFVHANLGPRKTRTGEIILDLTAELQNAIPNMTLLYDPDITPDDFAEHAIATSLVSANPAFAFDPDFRHDFGAMDYGIASCYNGLPIGGGAYLLHRLDLGPTARKAADVDDFMNNVLPHAVRTMCGFMEGCIRFEVEESAFFKTSFLFKEGLLDPDRFVGLFGMVGLSECVDELMRKQGRTDLFGSSEEANALGVRIMDRLQELVAEHHSAYCRGFDHHFLLHAQVGLGEAGVTPGVRIPIGRELPLYEHLRQAGLFHHYFQTGVGDIFPFETTARNNPGAILDIFKGAFKVGMRYISTYAEDSDLIRVTGYLVKKSEVYALHDEGKQAINDMSNIAYETLRLHHTEDRKVRRLDEGAD
ncbi:MAG: YjjI family glycine radical enzyme [Solobacterium sp.]|nr:YjjI family glycine radical enzyme [Solobacterium sp.]